MIKKNITFKLTLGFLSIVMVSTLFIGIIALNIFKNNIYEVKKNNMKKHAIAIAKAMEPYLGNDLNNDEFIKVMNLIKNIDNAKVWILKDDSSLLTASDNNDINYINDSKIKELYRDINVQVLDGKDAYDEGYNPYYNEEMMIVAVPIKDSSSLIKGVILNSPVSDLSNSIDKFFKSLILTVLGEIFIVGLLGYYFSRNISNPIKKINSSALELARGHYGIKTNIYQKDEIGELSSSFDLLSLKLKYTISELFEEKNKLSNIITSMSEGLLALDKNSNIINVNEAANSLLFSKKMKDDGEMINLLSQLGVINEFKFAIENNEKKSLVKKHENKILDFSISLIKNSLNEIMGGVILIQDISEKEKLEQMRKDFISNVSHEFRTPLTIIKGNLESIVDGMTKPTEVVDTCTALIKETNRLERMVKDLLNLSRLESGKVEIDHNELDVNMLINDTARSLRTLIYSKDIDLQLNLESNLPKLLSDYDKLKQLLIIFLDNAIKFSYSKGILKVTTYSDNKKIYIKVEDNGVGIPKEEIEYLGEKFFKADKSRNAQIEGTGLGLSIAKRLIKVLKGNFYIESDLRKGTTIIIAFSIRET
ncbi:HAMP domain-containing sensor histidine kinase [Clostridium cibarium]|uniref:histidine kinase n=1 Tax=Clostridium cibarium TaxID=2762247 RepID=A0ABR8PTY5_9CLOT|nr:ATP-binding protein [Clostridium cibarium]MBD7911575.1 HAMP domain-containing protein [Clostridium cibarium]